MARGPCTFRKNDVKKAVSAVAAAGERVRRVEVDKEGTIVIIVGEPDTSGSSNEWDEVAK